MFKTCDSDFNLERHLIPFLQDTAFYAELSRHIRKSFTRDLPTAAVTYDPRSDEMALFVNPDFFEKLSNWEIRGVLTHEFNHIVFGHLNTRRKSPGQMWNVATDLAINSLITEHAGKPRDVSTDDKDARPLPISCLIPGKWPVMPDGREMSKEEKEGAKLAALIAGFPKLEASEWYFNKIMELAQKEKKEQGEGGSGKPFGGEEWIDSIDDHTPWDDIPDEKREYVEGKIKSIIEKAVRHADSQSNGWGNIPSDIREDIRRSITGVINWRSVLRQFVGTLVRGSRTTSIKRINRRYPYIHPGIKRGYTAKLLIAMDQSGSVMQEWVEEFFGELSTLTKKVDVTLLPFDCYCDEKDLLEWKKGSTPKMQRTKMGGTDFNAPTAVFNDPKNRGRWDGLLILTDGGAGKPETCRAKRAWVLAKGCNLMFPTEETQVFMSKEKPNAGAWR